MTENELDDHNRQLELIEKEQDSSPMLSEVEPFDALLSLFQQNQPQSGFVDGINNYLSKNFAGMRRVRGDGNCFYRAFLFAYLEKIVVGMNSNSDLIVTKSYVELQRFKGVIDNSKSDLISLGYDELSFETFYDMFIELLDLVASYDTVEQLFEEFQEESGSTEYYVWYMRLMTSCSLKKNADMYAAFLDGNGCVDMNDYCAKHVEPMKTECEHLQISALTDYLEVQVHIHYLDGKPCGEGEKLVVHKFQEKQLTGDEAEATMYLRLCVHLLYRPGHYDVLVL